jgi:ABC-type bacteriocin/lantibiotic exporter with double-glycine peptidase domain
MKALGVKVSVKKLAKVCNTSPKNGTSELDIARGLKSLGLAPKFHLYETQKEFLKDIKDGTFTVPAICCVDNNNHWVVLLGILYDRVIVLDSNNSPKNKKVNGFHSYTLKKWFKRWTSNDKKYFGITIISGESEK